MRPPVKSTRKLETARIEAKLAAEEKFKYRFLDNRFSISKRLGSFFTYIQPHLNKIPKYAALAIGTILVKRTIDASEELLKMVQDIAVTTGFRFYDIMQRTIGASLGAPPFAEEVMQKYAEKTQKARSAETKLEIIQWGISFFIAYMLVEHGGEIIMALGEGAKGLTNFVKLFLPTGP